MKMKKDQAREKSSPVSAEESGAHAAMTDELSIVVEHMKKSNSFVKETNKELIKLNRGVVKQKRSLWVVALILFAGLVLSLREQHGLGFRLDAQLVQQELITSKLAEVVTKLTSVDRKTDETQQAIEEQPKISIKPADTSDPTSKPTLVVETKEGPKPKSSGGKPPKGVEIPLDFPIEDKK